MFSSSQRTKRRRGIILSSEGWKRLDYAQRKSEIEQNSGTPYTLENLSEITGLSAHTLTKVRRQRYPVDKQTLEDYFKAFGLVVTPQDYAKPIPPAKASPLQDCSSQVCSDLSQPSEVSLPGGQLALNSRFYLERSPVESNCFKTIMQPGSLLRIKAPRRMGKSSLMVRIVDRAAQEGYKTVFLSLQMADRSILQNLDKFLQWFSASVGLAINLPNRLDGYWDELFGSKISCKIYFEQYLLAKISQPIVLTLDDVDRLFEYPEIADEFFGLLRTWHEQAKNRGVWQKLRLVVAHSTEVYIPLNVNKSPFNVGVPIELEPLSAPQIEQLAEQYGLTWSSQCTAQLMQIVGGQPYLIQLGLFSLWQEQSNLSSLLEQAIAGMGIYANHLQRLLWTLEKDPALAEALRKVVMSSSPVELELLQAFKLESLGLVILQGNQAVSSCNLYTKCFRQRLS